MDDDEFPPAPICLISQEGEQLQVHADGMALLGRLGTTPVATVAVAGMYRTGKSFFLNQLCGAPGFKVGHTSESCTRGIWVWVVPSTFWSPSDHSGTRLLLLDTEGLASIDQDETYDAKVFSLAILLSSFFIYNSMGVIDEAAIDRLFLVGELTKNEGGGSSGDLDDEPAEADEGELAQFFPPFLWLLRDFHLDLEKDGVPITLEEYLEQALEDRPGASRRAKENNRIRHSFKALFQDRQVRTLVRPAVEESDLKQLASLPKEKLRPEFITQMDGIRELTLSRVKAKTLYGKSVTGGALAGLATAYVAAINGGAVPDIKKSWDYVVDESLRKAFEGAASLHADEMAAAVAGPPLPGRAAFDAMEAASRKASSDRFAQLAGALADHGAGDSWKAQLEERWAQAAGAGLADLERQSAEQCSALLAALMDRLLRKPEAGGVFDQAAGDGTPPEKLIGAAFDALLVEYDGEASGPAAERSLAEALRSQLMPVVQSWVARRDARQEAAAAAAGAALAKEQQAVAAAEAMVVGKDMLVAHLEGDKANLEASVVEEKSGRAAAESAGAAAREELGSTSRRADGLERDVAELERQRQAEADRAAEQRTEAAARLTEGQDDWRRREDGLEAEKAKVEAKVEELEARLEDSQAGQAAMAEEIGSYKTARLQMQHDMEGMARCHEADAAEAAARLAGVAASLEQTETVAAAAAAAAVAAAEAAVAEAEARANQSLAEKVVLEMVASVEAEAARQAGLAEAAAGAGQREQQLAEERDAVKAQLEQFVSKAANLPGAFQNQIFQGTPKWMEAVLNGEAVSADDVRAAGGEGGDEECVVM